MSGNVIVYGEEDEPDRDVARVKSVIGSEQDAKIVAAMPNDRVRAALALNLAGANYVEIANQLQFQSPAVARGAVERALAESYDPTEDRSKMRQKVSLTLDRMLKSISPKALNPENPEQLAAMRVALQIVDKKVALHGLNAPTEVTIRRPDSDEFSRVIELAAIGAGIELPEEADPWEIEAEVVEDGEAER